MISPLRADTEPQGTLEPCFGRVAPASTEITTGFFRLGQQEKDRLIDSLIDRQAFAADNFADAPHILHVDRPEGLIAIWHSQVGAVVADDPQDPRYSRMLSRDCERFVEGVVALHEHDLEHDPRYLKSPMVTPRSFAREVLLEDNPEISGPFFRQEYHYLHSTFLYAIGREPRRRDSIKVQASFEGGDPVTQHVHIDKSRATKKNPLPDNGFVMVKSVFGEATTEVVPRRMTPAEVKDAVKRRDKADEVATELGAIRTPGDSICMIKMFPGFEINHDVAVGHRFPTVQAGDCRLSIGMVE